MAGGRREIGRPDEENHIWAGLVYATQMSAMRILPAQLEFAREVLRQNAECLDALDRGLERGQLQFRRTSIAGAGSADTDFVSRLGEVARLHLIRFRLWFSEGDLVSAAEELFRLEKIGSMICNGEGQMLHYLIGLWLRAAAVRGFGHLAANIQTPRAVLERILETLDEGLKAPDGLAQSLRVDLCTIALAQLDRTVEDPDLEKVVDRLLEVYYVPAPQPGGQGSRPRACGHRRRLAGRAPPADPAAAGRVIPSRSIRRPPRG